MSNESAPEPNEKVPTDVKHEPPVLDYRPEELIDEESIKYPDSEVDND